ncbi:MAG: arginine repressor [Acidimicrobiia bacterium]
MRAETETRRRHLRSMIETTEVHSQADIRAALSTEGFDVTQATVSRDLDAIGATRVRANGTVVYRIASEATQAERSALYDAMDEFVISAAVSLNLIVLTVPPGAAQFVASRIDAADLDGVIGSIAGDDTILVIADETTGASVTLKELEGTE